MTSTTNSNFDPALKQIYRDSNLQKLTYDKRPALGLLPKFEGFRGRNMPIVLQYGNPMGRSAVFATAQSNRTQVRLEDFLLTRRNNYSVASVDGEVVESSRGDTASFIEALKLTIDKAMAALSDDCETELFRSGEGHMAQIGSVSSANPMVVTLLQTEEITSFDVGMVILADDTSTGASLRATPASVTVASVNRGSGTFTTAFDNSGPTTDWAANDYLFVSGDQATGAGTSNSRKMSGLAAWLPGSAPSGGESYFGVDRSVDSRLYGQVHTGTMDTLEDASIDAQSKSAREGGSPDTLMLHHAQVRRFNKELGAKKEYSETKAVGPSGMEANVSYRGITIQGDEGPINVIAANKCQANVGWLLQKDVWLIASIGPVVKILDEDGNRMLRQSTADGYEVRIGSRANLGCKAPIWNVRISLPTP